MEDWNNEGVRGRGRNGGMGRRGEGESEGWGEGERGRKGEEEMTKFKANYYEIYYQRSLRSY